MQWQEGHEFGPAWAIPAGIACGGVSAVQVAQACLDRIGRHNHQVNALVTLDEAGALAAAREADARTAAGHPPAPLHGVPISVKDAFATAGLRTTSSHPPLRNHVPEADATLVARLKAAGAVVVGKSNLPELAGDPQCWSPLFGPTNNPWNPALTPGGSSGGAAAAVAMGFSYLDPGSDIGGSIRIPAAFCGVAGLKATENRLPRTGHIPHLPDGQRSVRHMLSFGLLARYVEDLRLGFETMAGPDGRDTEVPPIPVAAPVPRGRPLRVAWWDDFCGLPVCRRTRQVLNRTVARLRSEGFEVARCCPAAFDVDRLWEAYGAIAGAEIGLGMPAMPRQALRWAGHVIPRSQKLARAFTRGLTFDWRRHNDALNVRERAIQELESFLAMWDVWMCPVAPTVAYPHCRLGGLRKPPEIQVDDNRIPYLEATVSMTTPFSLTGSPVVVLPAGVEDGLPVGLQFVGRRWQDEALLADCAAIERVLCGYMPPPLADAPH